MWTLATQLSLVAVFVAFATTIALLLRSRRPLYVRFGVFAAGIAFYYGGDLARSVMGPHTLLDSARIIAGAVTVAAATVFFDATLGEAGLSAQKRRRKTLFAAFALAIVGATPFASLPWVQRIAAVVVLLLLAWRGIAMIQRASEVESAAEQTRLRYLAYGGMLALVGLCCDFLALAGTGVPPFGGLAISLYLYFISQALLRSRLLDLHELLGKGLVFGTLALILAVVYGLLVVWASDKRGLFLFNTLLASSLILILFEPLKTYLEETTIRVFFREHIDFTRSLDALTKRIAHMIDVPLALEQSLDHFYDSKRATHAAVYFLDADRLAFQVQGFRGQKPASPIDAKNHPAIFVRAQKNQAVLLRENVTRAQRTALNAASKKSDEDEGEGEGNHEALLTGLDAMNADIVVPLHGEDEIVGFMTLKDERVSEAYTDDEINALSRLGEQVAVLLEHSRHFEVLKERDRLAGLGEMSAGLAHEIRNPLASIKAAAQELEPESIPEDDREMLEIIIAEVNRLNTVVTQFLDFARPFRGTFNAIGANDVVTNTVALLQREFPDVHFDVDLQEELPDMNGDAEQIKQVLINLILNAAQAIERSGTIEISTRAVRNRENLSFTSVVRRDVIELRVRDYGPGIPESVRKNLFTPFYTTKTKGTGLGLSLCQRIVQHHAGVIEVRSVVGRGATFLVRFPAIGARQQTLEPPEQLEKSADLPILQSGEER